MSNILPFNKIYVNDKHKSDKNFLDNLKEIDEYINKNNRIVDEYADILLKDLFSEEDSNNNISYKHNLLKVG